MAATVNDDYRWLVSDEGAALVARLAEDNRDSLTLQRTLRKTLSDARARLVVEQLELRRRARVKFRHADRLFFTRQALEQATDERLAAYKAARFAAGLRVADICCGIGGDLMSLVTRGPTTGIERDPIVGLFAAANVRQVLAAWSSTADEVTADGATMDGANTTPSVPSCSANASSWSVEAIDARVCSPRDFESFHIDPDRRSTGQRTTRLEGCEPAEDELRRWIDAKLPGAIKLAPATVVPDDWQREAEREWLGSRGECRQQTVWWGEIARHPGRRVATLVADSGETRTVVERPDLSTVEPASDWGRFLYEVDNTVLAAGLADSLAAERCLASVPGAVGYLTGDRELDDAALTRYEIRDALPFDRRRVREYLRTRGIGRVVVKKRGVEIDPEQVRRELSLAGDAVATIILAPWQGRVMALVSDE